MNISMRVWIQLAQDMIQWQGFYNKLLDSLKVENLLTVRATVSFGLVLRKITLRLFGAYV
jgi:hypothetical protein